MIRATILVPLETVADAQEALFALYRLNIWYLRQNPGRWPGLLSSAAGIRYAPEPRGRETWQTIPVLYANRRGDCEDLACALAASLTVQGIPAVPALVYVGPNLYHVVVRESNGREIDPSLMLGMDQSDWTQGTYPVIDVAPLSDRDVIASALEGVVGARPRDAIRRAVRPVGRSLARLARAVPVVDQAFEGLEGVRDAVRAAVSDATRSGTRREPDELSDADALALELILDPPWLTEEGDS